jgi:dCTP deaminase
MNIDRVFTELCQPIIASIGTNKMFVEFLTSNTVSIILGFVLIVIVPLLLSRQRRWTLLNDKEITKLALEQDMIVPFLPEKVRQGHLSGGLGHFGYDMHLSGKVKKIKKHQRVVEPTDPNEDLSAIRYEEHDLDGYVLKPGEFVLAFSKERFKLPVKVLSLVKDKSTLARLAIAVQNTVLEPGWEGYLTVELSNHGPLEIRLREEMPIAQMIFLQGNAPRISYDGRYQDQVAGTPAINNKS